MDDIDCLDISSVPQEYHQGARNAVGTCLSVKKDERVVLITDDRTNAIAAAILRELVSLDAKIECFVLEKQGNRPLAVLPARLAHALAAASASLLIVEPVPGELKLRSRVMELAIEHKLRHAHMPGVDHEMMITAMRADPHQMARLQDRLQERLTPSSVVSVRSPGGTDLEVRFTSKHRWVRADGLIKPGVGQNLPAGQLFTTPETVDGVYVADAAIGDWFGTKYPDISDYPVTVEIFDGRAKDAKSDNSTLARQLMLYLRSNVEGDRVGEFGIGTNLALTQFRGIALQDEQVPGAHIAFGGAGILGSTGAAWTAQTHVPLIARDIEIEVDGRPVMRAGAFDPDLLRDQDV